MSVADEEYCRACFEKFGGFRDLRRNKGTGRYKSMIVQSAWLGWLRCWQYRDDPKPLRFAGDIPRESTIRISAFTYINADGEETERPQ